MQLRIKRHCKLVHGYMVYKELAPWWQQPIHEAPDISVTTKQCCNHFGGYSKRALCLHFSLCWQNTHTLTHAHRDFSLHVIPEGMGTWPNALWDCSHNNWSHSNGRNRAWWETSNSLTDRRMFVSFTRTALAARGTNYDERELSRKRRKSPRWPTDGRAKRQLGQQPTRKVDIFCRVTVQMGCKLKC